MGLGKSSVLRPCSHVGICGFAAPGLKVTNNVLGDVLDPAFVIPKVNFCIMLPDVPADDAWCYPFKVPSKRVIVASQVPFEVMLLEGDVIFENWPI
ncbi:unnamed protein product [Cuscuta campestris]|uniref:Uncharacterized protein n=1 Tax=Cuscuta campestris TaxID=132261 RepID=A0A484LAK9_9ASTE|nr:unnamed protein product [Cuscuta campestris]